MSSATIESAPSGQHKPARQRNPQRNPRATRSGGYALLCGGVVDSYHSSNREALTAACQKYLHSQFSIKKVARRTADSTPI